MLHYRFVCRVVIVACEERLRGFSLEATCGNELHWHSAYLLDVERMAAPICAYWGLGDLGLFVMRCLTGQDQVEVGDCGCHGFCDIAFGMSSELP
jgi:hypothetical protein